MTPPAASPDEDLLAGLVADALARLERGEHVDLAELCADRQDLHAEVAEALGLRSALPALHGTARRPESLYGTRLGGRYLLGCAIGRGAAGTVFRARDERLARDVAVKVLHRDLLAGADAEARFQREARALAEHEHQHVVRIHDQGCTDDGTTYLVTELLQGTSLQAVLAAATRAMPEGPSLAAFERTAWLDEMLPGALRESTWLRQVVRWTAELGEGLAAAHARGVVHRDVKPSNAFVRTDGTAVLLDFGIAVRPGDPLVTGASTVLGTPCYMAPEQAAGRPEPAPTLDVYGLAATLYHLLTFRPPHTGDLQEVLVALRDTDPLPARTLHKGLPADLQAILDHGLAHDPRHRYQTMQALVDDLRAFLAHRPVAVRPLGALHRTLRHMRRHPARTAAALASLCLVLSLAIGLPMAVALQAHSNRALLDGLVAKLPAELSLEGWPDERLLVPLRERAAVLADLDRILELDPENPVRIVRAAERLDAGDSTGAAADVREIAHQTDSAYLDAIAGRYERATPVEGQPPAIALANLPEPRRPVDFFVAGFHALRGREPDVADDLLGRAGPGFLPARDLRLLAGAARKDPDADRLVAEASWLEGHYGRPTARTRHVLGAAMLLQKRYDAAVGYCEEALALRPDRHGPWHNLGLANLRLGRLEEAQRCYEKAHAIRPWFTNTQSGLCQALRQQGRFAEARSVAERIQDPGWRAYELGNVALVQAIVARADAEAALASEMATAAEQHFAEAAATPPSPRTPKARSVELAARLAGALAANDMPTAAAAFLLQLRSDPRNPRQLANLSWLLADTEITDEVRRLLRLFLLDLAVELAPGDPEYQRLRARLLEQLRTEPPK